MCASCPWPIIASLYTPWYIASWLILLCAVCLYPTAPTQRLRLTSQPVYRGVKLGTDGELMTMSVVSPLYSLPSF